MKYRLNDYMQLCGFKGLPFALFNGRDGTTAFYRREEYKLILDCDGETEINVEDLSEDSRAFLEHLLENGVVGSCNTALPLSAFSRYREFPNPFKDEVQWSVTGDCNFRCKHCFMSAPEAKFGVPAIDRLLDIVGQLADAGIRKVGITGGEPLIRRDFMQIIDALLSRGICVTTIYTNGALVNDALLSALEYRHCRPAFQISFDGVGWHDWLRGIPGAEQLALNAIRLLNSRGFSVSATMVVHKKNADSIAETIRVLAEAGCRSLKLGKAEDLGCWNEMGDLSLTNAETQQFYLDCIDTYVDAGMPLSLELAGSFGYDAVRKTAYVPADKLWDYTEAAVREQTKENRFYQEPLCGVIKKTLYIAPDGRVLPCMSMIGMPVANRYPSLFDMSLKDILCSSSYQEDTVCRVSEYMAHNPECARCRYAANCRGGCRATALKNGSSDYLSKDTEVCEFFLDGWYESFAEKASKLNALSARKAAEKPAPAEPVPRTEGLKMKKDGSLNGLYDAVMNYLTETYHPESIIVMGSFADGSADEYSDFDAFLIADAEQGRDTSTIQGTLLDVYIIPPSRVASFFNPELYIRLFCGETVLDRNERAELLLSRVRDYENSRVFPDRAALAEKLNWCEKILIRSKRADTESLYRLHYMFAGSLELYTQLTQRLYTGEKKTLREMARNDPTAFRLFDDAARDTDAETVGRWIGHLRMLLNHIN